MKAKQLVTRWWVLLGTGVLAGGAIAGLAVWPALAPSRPAATTEDLAVVRGEAPPPQTFTGHGVAVEFTYFREGAGPSPIPLFEGERAQVRFRLTDATTGEPLRGLSPAGWLDLEGPLAGSETRSSCREKVPLYLKGHVGIRPMVDLNSYFLLVLNGDPTITVIDPLIGMAGKTNLYTTVRLRKPGADWVASADGRRLFVSMPRADAVAVIDTETFRVIQELPVRPGPTRLALQGDGRYLWVGTGGPGIPGGVAVIDAESLETVTTIITGRGHHEVAFGPGDRIAFVTNRESGTVTAIDVARLSKQAELRTGPLPISIALSPLSEAIYVADGKSGEIAVIDPGRIAVTARIPAKPGLGPLRFAPGGRYGLVVNPAEQVVHVIDAATNGVTHTLPMPGQPFGMAFTDLHAYVRLLDSERVQMIRLSSLGSVKPIVQEFAAGSRQPGLVPELSLADSMVPQTKGAGVFVVSPGDGATFGYMEGMNAPAGSFHNYGHSPRAVRVVDRSLREEEPGVYTAHAVPPAAGSYDVALLLDTPPLVHCFRLEARENPRKAPEGPALELDWATPAEPVVAGSTVPLRFQLADPFTRGPKLGLDDVRLAIHGVVGPRAEVWASEVETGVYEAEVRFPKAGPYYVHVAAPAEGVNYGDLPYRAIRVDPPFAK